MLEEATSQTLAYIDLAIQRKSAETAKALFAAVDYKKLLDYVPTDKKGNLLRGERSQAVANAKLIKEAFTQTLTEKQQKDNLHLELYNQSLKVKDLKLHEFIKLTKEGESQPN